MNAAPKRGMTGRMTPPLGERGASGAVRSTLRLATPADAVEIEAVHWAGLEGAYLGRVPGWREEPRVVDDRVRRWTGWPGDPEIDTVVAESHGTIVGFCTLRACTQPDLDERPRGEMPTLYVHPEHWRRGYGRKLCLEILRRARDRGFSSVVLWVMEVNERARLFYEGIGFRFDGTSQPVTESKTPLMAHRYSIEIAALE